MSQTPVTKKLYSSRDAAPSVLHGLREAESEDAYPIIIDRHGGLRGSQTPTNQQMRVEYNDDNTQKYIGFNDMGKAETDDDWLLHYLEYDSKRRVIKRTIAYGSWTNHADADFS